MVKNFLSKFLLHNFYWFALKFLAFSICYIKEPWASDINTVGNIFTLVFCLPQVSGRSKCERQWWQLLWGWGFGCERPWCWPWDTQPAMCRGILCGTFCGLIPTASFLCTSQQNTQYWSNLVSSAEGVCLRSCHTWSKEMPLRPLQSAFVSSCKKELGRTDLMTEFSYFLKSQ